MYSQNNNRNRRIVVYIDGFNLYYGAVRFSPFKWLDPKKLASKVIPGTPNILRIRYFTARVRSPSWNPGQSTRQNIYLQAIQTTPEVYVHYGMFVERKVRRPLASPLPSCCSVCNVDNSNSSHTRVHVKNFEEKGSDVNLASYLLMDGFQDLYDEAWVFSNDSDLAEPVRMVRDELGKYVGIVVYDRNLCTQRRQTQQVSRHLVKASSRQKPIYIKKRHLKASQLPDPVITTQGRRIRKPSNW